jgi:hypothetical protein
MSDQEFATETSIQDLSETSKSTKIEKQFAKVPKIEKSRMEAADFKHPPAIMEDVEVTLIPRAG